MSNYVLVRRQNYLPRQLLTGTITELLPEHKRGQLWAIDFETKGLLPWTEDFEILTLGMADQDGCFALDAREFSSNDWNSVLLYLSDCKLIAFNTYFDAGALLSKGDAGWAWVGDAYALFKSLSTEGWDGQSWSLDTAIEDILGWPTNTKQTMADILTSQGYTKADLWRLPHDVIGPYCAGDADATWQLWQYLRTVNLKVTQFHQQFFMPQVRLMLQQAFKGMVIDRDVLLRGRDQLRADMTAAHAGFFNSPGVASYAAGEPTKLTPKGNITSRWRAWNKAQKAGTQLELNINSKAQLADLFFNHLGCHVLKTTPTGKPVLDKKILPALGPEGKLLATYNKLKKQDGYVKKVVQLSVAGLIRPTFNTVGTVTLRPSGTGGFNLLQMPKTPALLAAFVARPGHKLVQADLEALEPTILAQFSRDPTMLSIYGPDAKPNDIYLYVAARIPALGKNILQYYDPANPTKEGIKLAKEHCKRDRQVAKTVQLASAYGAGAQKIYDTLMLDGIQITLPEVRVIMRDYWRLFAGVKRFEAQLQAYWEQSGGYIPSIIGTPICVDAKYTKDLVNRFCQTSAAIVLQIWVTFADELFRARQIPATPWNLNMYDETVWEVPNAYADAAAKVLADALTMANQFLRAEIPFKAPPMICDNMAQWKCPDTYQQWKESQS